MNGDTIKNLTLMLMYLTSWEESLVPNLREKPDRPGFRSQIRRAWKGYDFGILNELTNEGLVNAGGRSKSASFTDEGEEKARELLKQYGIAFNPHGGEVTVEEIESSDVGR